MKRLNDRAFDLLQTEIRQYKNSHAVGQVQIELVLRRLEMRQTLLSTAHDSNQVDRSYVVGQLNAIIAELEKVEPNTTIYSDAQKLKESAKAKLK